MLAMNTKIDIGHALLIKDFVQSVLVCTQIEDMLKRSFAEFHAQRSHPEALQKLAEGTSLLQALRAKPWPHSPQGTSQQDVEDYYHLSQHIQSLTAHIQASGKLSHSVVVFPLCKGVQLLAYLS